jgi:hypothetical protein
MAEPVYYKATLHFANDKRENAVTEEFEVTAKAAFVLIETVGAQVYFAHKNGYTALRAGEVERIDLGKDFAIAVREGKV